MKRRPAGFTLVELMVPMVILMFICPIAIPSNMSAVQRTHEAVAVSFLRQVETSQEAYRLSAQQYADTFAKLQPSMSAELEPPALPQPGLMNGFVTVAYAEPLPSGGSQGSSGPAPGQSGSAPGQSGSTPSQGSGGSATSGSGSNGAGTQASDSKVYSKCIFELTLTGPL
jgi:type II secretory pathway pseudopilin PulG